ncbi:MAG TPA: hypothetical protein VE733_25470 [Streptosporangiaceae bacterium]|jgi:hypothetical protein|nr:hypothetical protein [Streptosporangiaceae bacterium]
MLSDLASERGGEGAPVDEAGPRENRPGSLAVDDGHVVIGGADSAVEREGDVKAGLG